MARRRRSRPKKRFKRGAAQAFGGMRRRYGSLELTLYTGQVTAGIDLERRQRLLLAAQVIHDILRNDVLTGPRSGQLYRVPHTRRYYRASAPGEPPAERTSRLRYSYAVSPARASDIDERVVIGTSVPYARILELALDRAHLFVAYERARPQLDRILRSPYR